MSNPSIEEILFSKEKSGLQNQNRVRTALFLLFSPAAFFLTANNGMENYISLALVILGVSISLFLLYRLKSFSMPCKLNTVAYLGISIDLFIIVSLNIIWFFSLGTDSPPHLLLRSSGYFIAILFLSLMTMPLIPQYILISWLAVSSLFTGFFLFVVLSPATVFASTYLEGYTTGKFHTELEFVKLMFLNAIGITSWLSVKSSRKSILEAARTEIQKNQLGKYFSPAIAEEISSSSLKAQDIQSGGKISNIAILFSDIRNFTEISNKQEPDEILEFLSEYHEIMVDCIFRNGGTLDKFIGDAIMATFGTPRETAMDADNALQAALEMNREMEVWNRQRADKGLFVMQHGIGIHFGPALVGNIGSQKRLEFTVLGNAVNIASRIESLCKNTGKSLLFSADLLHQITQRNLKEKAVFVDKVRVRGVEEEMEIYTT